MMWSYEVPLLANVCTTRVSKWRSKLRPVHSNVPLCCLFTISIRTPVCYSVIPLLHYSNCSAIPAYSTLFFIKVFRSFFPYYSAVALFHYLCVPLSLRSAFYSVISHFFVALVLGQSIYVYIHSSTQSLSHARNFNQSIKLTFL